MTLAQTINGALRRVPVWPVYVIGALPPVWYLYLGLTGGLGVEPIKEFEHRLGILGLQMLIAVLAVTPLRNMTDVSLIRFRRALGLLTFYYIACHLAVWLFLDVQIAAQIWADIVKRPYITIGMAGFVLMLPLPSPVQAPLPALIRLQGGPDDQDMLTVIGTNNPNVADEAVVGHHLTPHRFAATAEDLHRFLAIFRAGI